MMHATKKIKQGKVWGERGTGHRGSGMRQEPAWNVLGTVGQERNGGEQGTCAGALEAFPGREMKPWEGPQQGRDVI